MAYFDSFDGARHVFGEYRKNDAWHDVGGVYAFGNEDGSQVYYVGICDSFRNRMCTHERWDEAVRLGATRVFACVVPSILRRGALEREMIAQINPPLNTHHRLTGLLA